MHLTYGRRSLSPSYQPLSMELAKQFPSTYRVERSFEYKRTAWKIFNTGFATIEESLL